MNIPLDVVCDHDESDLAINGGHPSIPEPSRRTPYPVFTNDDIFQLIKTVSSDRQKAALEVQKLTEEYLEHVGAKHALATSSGTSSLHIALAAAGIEPGDEVVVPCLTFIATAMAVLHVKAIPVFADIDLKTFCLCPRSVEKAITPKTRAIMPVHLHGLPADMPALNSLAKKRNIVIVEDASHAHSAAIGSDVCGSLGITAGQSLMADKNYMVGGEGGITFFSDENLLDKANSYIEANGLDYQMSWVAAAIGRSQLRRLNYYDLIRARNARLLDKKLAEIGGFVPPFVPEGYTHSYNMYRITIDPEVLGLSGIPIGRLKEAIKIALLSEGVPAREWQNVPIPFHAPFVSRVGWGNGFPWSTGKSVDYRYQIEDFPNAVKILESTLVLCREMRSPVETERIDRYALAFKKIKRNKDIVANLARDIDYIPCYQKDPRLG